MRKRCRAAVCSNLERFVILTFIGSCCLLHGAPPLTAVTNTVPTGLSLLGNPFRTNILVSGLFANPPEGLQVSTFNRELQQYEVNQFQFGAWSDPGQAIAGGSAAVVRNPAAELQVVLSGVYEPASASFPSVAAGLNLLSVFHANDLVAVQQEEDLLFQLRGGQYLTYQYALGTWDAAPVPPLRPGEGVFYQRGAGVFPGCGNGLVYLNNHVPGTLDERIVVNSCIEVTGPEWQALLYVVRDDGPPLPVGKPLPFLTGIHAGYLDVTGGAVFCVPGTAPGDSATLFLRIWQGDSFEQAAEEGRLYGQSAPFTVTLGGGVLPPAFISGFRAPKPNAGLCLRTAGVSPSGAFALSFIGQSDRVYTLEASFDLKSWSAVQIFINPSGPVIFEDSDSRTGVSSRFYRVRQIP
jgi:hypothetical protein